MGKAEQKAKNQAMAQRMKEQGIRRTTALCPVHNNHLVSIPFSGTCNRSK